MLMDVFIREAALLSHLKTPPGHRDRPGSGRKQHEEICELSEWSTMDQPLATSFDHFLAG